MTNQSLICMFVFMFLVPFGRSILAVLWQLATVHWAIAPCLRAIAHCLHSVHVDKTVTNVMFTFTVVTCLCFQLVETSEGTTEL